VEVRVSSHPFEKFERISGMNGVFKMLPMRGVFVNSAGVTKLECFPSAFSKRGAVDGLM
jgi:hypothetical protein